MFSKGRHSVATGLVIGGMILTMVLLAGAAQGQPPENWTAGIAYDIVPEAKITKVGWYMGKTEGGVMLIYEVGIMNTSAKPVRFRLTIYPLEGDPIAGLYPLGKRKGKPLALEPKEEMVLKWPMMATEFPKGFALVVKGLEE
jgi:hypothetical protein